MAVTDSPQGREWQRRFSHSSTTCNGSVLRAGPVFAVRVFGHKSVHCSGSLDAGGSLVDLVTVLLRDTPSQRTTVTHCLVFVLPSS